MIKIKYIIHGGSSFLGKHFIKLLINNNKNLIVISRESSRIVFKSNFINHYKYKNSISEINLENYDLSHSIFFEFAWFGVYGNQRNDIRQFTVNIPLFVSGIEFAKKNNCKHWVGIGSQAEYGNLNKKIDEKQSCFPTTLYGKSKLYLSKITKDICDLYSINHSWLRLFSVYGPDDNHEWFIQYLIKKMLKSEEINVTKCEQYWDYLFIEDLVSALYKIKVEKSLGITNLSSNNPIQIRELIEILQTIIKTKSKINFGAIPYRDDQVMFMCGDNTKLKNELNWYPIVDFQDGLTKTIGKLKK